MHLSPEPSSEIAFHAHAALQMVRERGLLALTSNGGAPSLVESVTGGPVKGSWSEHPASKLIYDVAEALGSSPEVLMLRLVGGKVTFLHQALWPALLRVARDPVRAQEAAAQLSPCAARLHAEVDARGEVRLDALARQPSWPPERDLARAGKELEAAFLVHGASVRNDRGRTSTLLRSWIRAVPETARREAARLSLEGARELLDTHGAILFPSRRDRGSRSSPRAR